MVRKKGSDEGGEDILVQKDDMVAAVGTGKVSFMPKGKKFMVHSIAAEKLFASGKATPFKQGGEE